MCDLVFINMSQKDKETNTLNKLKLFFFREKNASGSNRENKIDTNLLREMEALLQPQLPVAQRCRTLRDLCESDRINRLEDASIQKLWELTKDLIAPSRTSEQRHIAFTFYRKLIQSQYEDLSLMREHFFNVIQNHDVPEDIQNRLDLLKTLTENGKNIKNVDDTIGEFTLNWMQAIVDANLTQSFLEVIVNIIQYNAGYLDARILAGYITHACGMCCSLDDTQTVLQCLHVLDAALCYTVFPTETLSSCIVALCRTVNKETYCQASWKIMKKLLGTNLGHAALLYMCSILDKSTNYDEALLRGAVFHINMGLWGSTGPVVPMFKSSPSAILMSFCRALKCQRIIVTYEVILAIQRLINLSGKDLSEPSWDVLCDILLAISKNINYYETTNELPQDRVIQNAFHETLNKIEQLLQRNEAATDPDKIYSVIEHVCEDRSEQSIIQLIEYKAMKISPTQPQWLQTLSMFMNRFFNMRNINIRNQSIQVMSRVMQTNRAAYEEEILERIVIPLFSNIHHENETSVRTSVGKLLLDFVSHCDTKRSLEMLDVVEKLFNRSFDKFADEGKVILKNENELSHIATMVDELIRVFVMKLYHLPASHAIKIFQILTGHLEKYYQKPVLMEPSVTVRKRIFAWMLRIRANATYNIGYPDEKIVGSNAIRFSHYLSIELNDVNYRVVNQTTAVVASVQTQQQQTQQQQQQQPSSFAGGNNQTTLPESHVSLSPETLSTIPIRRSCKIIIECLKSETDWSIVQLVLKELANVLQNKALLRGIDMDTLAISVINLHKTYRNRIDTFVGIKPNLSDFQSMILTTIAALIPYHQCLSQQTINRIIIQSLRPGLLSLDPYVCVHAFTIMLLEVLEIMLRHLPEILLEMSKMSTTLNVAVPVLEFLSSLNRVPSNRFDNFVEVQYRYVFAIALPYTNPHKYDHYTVSLAHHVIAGWYLKCKLPLRRNFVDYILKGFMTNVQKPFEETKRSGDFINEDSSNRKRSSSLTERGPKNRDRPTLQNLSIKNDETPDEMVYNFHMELAETCIDFLARHCYSMCSALPKRLPITDFLLVGAQTKSWLIGHNIVTITTSGCSSVSTKNSLCDRCASLCKMPASSQGNLFSPLNGSVSPEVKSSSDASSIDISHNKRYTKASLLHNSGQDSESTDVTSSTSSSIAATPYPLASEQPSSGKFFRQTTNEGRGGAGGGSSNSSSLEALSRRGSNPDAMDNTGTDSTTTFRRESILQQSVDRSKQTCVCLCSGWAEILIRRPTGNMSWIMRIQNQMSLDAQNSEIPLQNLISMMMPSLGAIYSLPDASSLTETSQLHGDNSSHARSTVESAATLVQTSEPSNIKKRLIVADVPSLDSKLNSEESTPKREDSRSTSTSHRTTPELVSAAATSDDKNSSASTLLSGPIDIPKSTHPYKIPSGSFSDVEPELDDEESADVAFEENDSRSRNPVRRVNSSPEMSSNYRHPFVAQKSSASGTGAGTQSLSNSSATNIANIHVSGEDDSTMTTSGADIEQQQKKKNFSKERVNCEAIPEEITDSTPPNHHQQMEIERQHSNEEKVTIANKNFQDFTTKAGRSTVTSHSTTCASLPTSRGPSTDIPLPNTVQLNLLPRKQHSADDALQQRGDQTGEDSSIAALGASSSTRSLSTTASTIVPLSNTMSNVKVKLSIDMPKLTTKPPQSHVPLSPRLLAKSGGMSLLGGSGNGGNIANDFQRGRSKTISVVRERGNTENDARHLSRWTFKGNRAGISPSSVFLQLFNSGSMKGVERPIQIQNHKAITLLDLIPPFETHKIGVLYVGRGQCNNETEILRNRYGSLRYVEFLQNLGTLVSLKHARDMNIFIDMETDGRDGNFTYVWQDDIVQVTFHVATLMPNKDHDPNCNEKKKNIGNDFVSIVYNESGDEYDLNTIKGQFNYACVVVQPLELNSNRIFIKCKNDVSQFICHTEPNIISDNSAPRYARLLALHANLASLVANSLKTRNSKPYASNWLERLRRIKHERAKVMKEVADQGPSASTSNPGGANNNTDSETQWLKEDFTKYTN